jgi:anti-sigma B factor antagonist
MPAYKHINVMEIGDVTVVGLRYHSFAEDNYIQEVGSELHSLAENDKRKKLLLNFSMVEFIDGPILWKLIMLDRKLKAQGGKMKISNLSPDCRKVFSITKLELIFDIQEDEADALAAF